MATDWVLLPPPTLALVGLSEYVHGTDVVVVELLDVVEGGTGSGASELVRNMEMLAIASGLGVQELVPGAPPVHRSVNSDRVPENSRSAVQPLGVLAVSLPMNTPPVSSGSRAPPNTPLTVPVVPLSIT